ncbi:hypothetical protein EVAR_10102_1 [Eumeta japonica]|uniref:Uncharacterized protein n=1 Tax=Eumeta variegata TaxID=151549 RepID=A0A4C1UC35_EUMVA|nr:hypothetical protein EVAR_10102_1 [Eumeta japonica]
MPAKKPIAHSRSDYVRSLTFARRPWVPSALVKDAVDQLTNMYSRTRTGQTFCYYAVLADAELITIKGASVHFIVVSTY